MAGTAPGETWAHRGSERDLTANAGTDRAAAVSDVIRGAPLQALIIAGSVGYGLGYLTALTRGTKPEPLPDYARKRAY